MFVDGRRRMMHDKIAGTVVVKIAGTGLNAVSPAVSATIVALVVAAPAVPLVATGRKLHDPEAAGTAMIHVASGVFAWFAVFVWRMAARALRKRRGKAERSAPSSMGHKAKACAGEAAFQALKFPAFVAATAFRAIPLVGGALILMGIVGVVVDRGDAGAAIGAGAALLAVKYVVDALRERRGNQ